MIIFGDARKELQKLSAGSVSSIVTSPPYFQLRDYGDPAQIGLEKTTGQYLVELVRVFRSARKALKDNGTLWIVIGDSYIMERPGRTSKNLAGIPWKLAFALQADGWILRQDIVWSKPNPSPENCADRCTRSHEYIFMFSKQKKYYYDQAAIAEDSLHPGMKIKVKRGKYANSKSGQGRTGDFQTRRDFEYTVGEKKNRRSVWEITTKAFTGSHFATYPPDLVKLCILAGCPKGGTVLDPFYGSGTTGVVAELLDRKWIGIELNEDYKQIQHDRREQITEAVRWRDK